MGSMNSVAPEVDWSCTRPGTLARYSAFTGRTYRSLRTVMMGSCRYFWKEALRTIWFSFSLMRSVAPRRWRRMFISSALARSAISSSERIASVMSCSRCLSVQSPSAFWRRRGVLSRSVTSASRAVREARSSSATESSALGDSVAPLSARARKGRTSWKAIIGCPPMYCKTTAASSVSCCHS